MQSLSDLQKHTGDYSTEHLDAMVVLLRDENVRADSGWMSVIPRVLQRYSDHQWHTARVLVNFAADNDSNRLYLASDNDEVCLFWTYALEGLGADDETNYIITLLLTQFLHNIAPETRSQILELLLKYNVTSALINYCDACDAERAELAIEVLAQYASEARDFFGRAELEWAVRTCERWSEDPEGETAVLYAATVILNIAQNENIVVDQHIIRLIYGAMTSARGTDAKRSLFSACGYISSAPSYSNMEDTDLNVKYILSTSNGYVVAAAAVSLGNCVESDESRTQLLQHIGSKWPQVVQTVLAWPYGDVGLFQALHLFNNTMTPETLSILLSDDNRTHLARITKVVVDNCTYHREVGELFFKFVRKMLVAGMPPLKYQDIWEYIGHADAASGRGVVDMHLLQGLVKEKESTEINQVLLVRLFGETLTVEPQIDAHLLLLKLHTLAVVLQEWKLSSFQHHLGVHLDQVVSKLHDLMEQVSAVEFPQTAQGAAVANNTQYVAAVCMNTFNDGNYSLLVETCRAIAGQ